MPNYNASLACKKKNTIVIARIAAIMRLILYLRMVLAYIS